MRSKAILAVMIALALVILGVGAAGYISLSNPVKVSNKTIHLKSGTSLKVRCFTPLSADGSRPLAVVCHGMFSGKEYMDWLSLAIARSGYTAVSPDFPTDRDESNIPLLVELMQSLIAERHSVSGGIAVVGHSLGAIEALNAAYTVTEVRAVVAIGLYVGGEVNLPSPNVLIITGMYDRYFPPEERIASIRSFTGGSVSAAGILTGSFQHGNARKLMISPYSFHGAEVMDPFILRETVGWLNAVSKREGADSILPVWDGIAYALIALGAVIAILCLPFVHTKGYRLSSLIRWLYPAISGFLTVMAALRNMEGSWAALLAGAVCIAMVIAPLPSQTVNDTEEAFGRFLVTLKRSALFLMLLWLFFALAVIIRDVLPMGDLRLLKAAPFYLFILSVCYPLFFSDAFLRHYQDIQHVPFICMLLMLFVLSAEEAFRPGTVAAPVSRFMNSMLNLKLQKSKEGTPFWQYGLLVLCVLLGLGLWAGVISREKPQVSVTISVLCSLLTDGVLYLCIPFAAASFLYRRYRSSSHQA